MSVLFTADNCNNIAIKMHKDVLQQYYISITEIVAISTNQFAII